MKPIHWNKVAAIALCKSRAFLGKNCIIMPIFALGFTLLMRFLYEYLLGGQVDIPGFANAYALGMGLVMNIGMTGIYCPALLLAEEKEKHTLRVLMTSSVNGLEFFLGSVLPIFLATVAMNFLLLPLSGYSFSASALPVFVLVSVLASLISCIIGMLLGIFAKNQVTAGTITSPILLIFVLVPMLSNLIEAFRGVSQFVFTGIMMDLVMNAVTGVEPLVSVSGILVMGVEVLAALALFLVFYKRNGFEKD